MPLGRGQRSCGVIGAVNFWTEVQLMGTPCSPLIFAPYSPDKLSVMSTLMPPVCTCDSTLESLPEAAMFSDVILVQ